MTDIRIDRDIPPPRSRSAQNALYFDALVRLNHSVLVKYEEFTSAAKYRHYARLSNMAHRRKVLGLGAFSCSQEAQGVRIWRVGK